MYLSILWIPNLRWSNLWLQCSFLKSVNCKSWIWFAFPNEATLMFQFAQIILKSNLISIQISNSISYLGSNSETVFLCFFHFFKIWNCEIKDQQKSWLSPNKATQCSGGSWIQTSRPKSWNKQKLMARLQLELFGSDSKREILLQSFTAEPLTCSCRLGGKLMSFWAFVIFSRDENTALHPNVQ